jgi:hypothetical protein
MDFKELLFFNKMVTPLIITGLYCLISVVVLVSGIITLATAGILQGLAVIIFGLLGVRIWFELLVLMFKINDNLQKLVDRG